ncbi:hypothetical protein EGW08_013170 [Elysia chlorotica]|uniref:Uncharacterized protein n=1 Tax=Elysia chlorotica TaxID=188477 RepID=A0A433TBU0_ELYCH|nr:hypothetical protein EGW08_013170 [Elysia chlorotica]
MSQPSGSASYQSCSQTSLPMEDRRGTGGGGGGAGESTGACQHQDAGSSWTEAKASRSHPHIIVGSDAAGNEAEEAVVQEITSKLALLNASAAASSDSQPNTLSLEDSLRTDATGSQVSTAVNRGSLSATGKERAKPKPRRMLPGLSRSSPSLPDEPGARYPDLDPADISISMSMASGEGAC